MKKAIVLALAALVTSAWAAPALAGPAPGFSYGGFLRYRYTGGDTGTVFDSPELDGTMHQFQYRFRPYFNYRANEHVSTSFRFDLNGPRFGEAVSAQNTLNDGSGSFRVARARTAAANDENFRILEAWIRFDVPNAPVTLTIGKQSFSTPKDLIHSKSGDGVKLAVRAAGGEHTLFWNRAVTGGLGDQTGADDGDWWGIVPSFTLGGVRVSPHLSYLKTGKAATGFFPDAEVIFAALNTSGKLGAIGFTFDVTLQTGEAGAQGGAAAINSACFASTGGPVAGQRCDVLSYVIDASVTLGVGPGNLTLKALYSPGDDNPDDADVDRWVEFFNTDIGWSPFFHDGTSVGGNMAVVTENPGVANGGIMAVGLEFAFSPRKDLTVTPNIYYLMAAEDVNVRGGPADDLYGIEVGISTTWRLWDTVAFLAQFDYIFAGDVFKPATGDAKDTWRVVLGPSMSW
ncbi:MAG TPA: major outer membrane protein [Thermodesulfobacteriota bacterium]|nr:major outer membrane protein [Thermodesulfobacteriota bacterium]